jgi:hypothetical protein
MTALSFVAAPEAAKSGRTVVDPARKLALFEQLVTPHLDAARSLALANPQRP